MSPVPGKISNFEIVFRIAGTVEPRGEAGVPAGREDAGHAGTTGVMSDQGELSTTPRPLFKLEYQLEERIIVKLQ